MSRFDRYLLAQLMMLFGFFALILVSVYWVNRAVRLFDQLISDGQSAWVFLEFTALTLPYVINLVLPVAAFVATIYVTNRLSQESELAVMQATGFSPFRMARPVIVFGMIVAILMSILAHILVPTSRTQLAERTNEIAQNVTAGLLVEGTFLHPAGGIALYIRDITEQGELQDIFLSDARSESRRVTYTAERAFLVRSDTGPKLVMIDGMAQNLELPEKRLFTTRFADFTYDIGALISGGDGRRRDVREFSTLTLLNPTEADIAQTAGTRAVFLYEGHDRIAQPLMAVFVPMIGFGMLLMGGFSRLGLWRQIGAAVVALVVVQFVVNAAADMATKSTENWPATYSGAAVAALIGFTTLWWAGRPRRVPPAATGGAT